MHCHITVTEKEKTMKLSYRTRCNTAPYQKAKVYFTAHPDDYDACFELIAGDLLDCKDCAVFFNREPSVPTEPYQLSEMLSEMNLFVIPITSALIRGKSLNQNTEFQFAIENHIPVLFLIEEQELASKAFRPGGGIPVLSRYRQSNPDKPYMKQLCRYLDSVLIEDELAEKVRAVFDTRVFLGCRKKDRKTALTLMHLIHEDPMCRNIAIVHDDFLSPDESFSDAVSDMLHKSDLFLLAATPGLLEEDNYVMRFMYPMAKYANTNILAAELRETESISRELSYLGIPHCTVTENLSESVIQALPKKAEPADRKLPEELFLTGLAYLNGIDVEVNHEMALQLIAASAENGLPEAVAKLATMYRYGNGVEIDPEKAYMWRDRFAEIKKGQEANSPQSRNHQEKPDSVNFSVLSPKAVKPDSYGIINLHMYTDIEREVVEQALRESNGLINETKKAGFEINRGTSITARLESRQAEIEIDDPLETQMWNGKNLHFDFQFYVPEDFSRSQIAFVCYIECNGIPITRLNFITAVSKLPESEALPAKVTKSDYKKAFISYSRKDEQRMLERVVGIQELAPEMKFWLDKQSLDAGVVWREEIKKAITISDVLLLFWSVPASKSKEVEMEWTYALDQKGLSFIAPVPLDPPAMCPPPARLKALNFTVRSFYRNELTEKLSYYDSNNIVIIS